MLKCTTFNIFSIHCKYTLYSIHSTVILDMGKAAVLVVNIYTLLVTCTEQCTVYTVLYNAQFLFGNKTLY